MPEYSYPEELKRKIINYYEDYYRSCGLKDFRERARQRLHEEKRDERIADFIQKVTNFSFSNGQRHLIVGAGTGGMVVVLKELYGCEVYGVEPNQIELEIIHQKCKVRGIALENFTKEGAEEMGFADNQFDFVHCYTVLEHVQDVKRSLNEMVRVTKPGGFIYIHTPNYNFPYEGHYKMLAPTFLPKIFTKLWFKVLKRPADFLSEINFLRPHGLDVFFDQQGWVWYRIYRGEKVRDVTQTGFLHTLAGRLQRLLRRRWFVYPHQEIIIRKL